MSAVQAAFYDRLGPAAEVLQLGELPEPVPGPGEVRVRLRWSGVNPSDVKSRAGLRSKLMPFARVVPHSDGMGVIDAIGTGVPAARAGERVWVWNAAWGRPMGTAAQAVVLPARQAVRLPEGTPDEAGACLGIPALTALHAVQMSGGVAGQRVLVAAGARAPSACRCHRSSRRTSWSRAAARWAMWWWSCRGEASRIRTATSDVPSAQGPCPFPGPHEQLTMERARQGRAP